MSEDTSFLRGKSVFLLSIRKVCKKPPHAFAQSPYICGYDGGSADISVGPSLTTFTDFRDRSNTFVAYLSRMNAIVGNDYIRGELLPSRIRKNKPENAYSHAIREVVYGLL